MRALAVLSAAIAVAALGACSGGAGGTPATGTSSEPVTSARKVPQPSNPYTLFETLQVRPLALSPDGQLLYATNTPDNRLEIFRVEGHRLQSTGSVVVGLEPVAVAVRSNGEVWVVNHLSDSREHRRRSTPSASRASGNTLLVGDEPRDIVFARPGPEPGVHHDRPPRPELARTIRICSRPASVAPTSGCSTRTTSVRRRAGRA